VDADADVERGHPAALPVAVEARQRVHLLEGALDRAHRTVGVRHRRAPEGHDPVAHELVERPLLPEDHLDHELEVLVQDVDHHLRGDALAHARETADVAVEDRALLDVGAALLHVELAGDHLLGHVRRQEAREALAGDDLLLDLGRQQRVGDEHRRLAGHRLHQLEVFLRELVQHLRVEPQRALEIVLVQQRHDDGARDAVQHHRAAVVHRAEVLRRVLREDALLLLDDVTQDRRRDADRRVRAIAAVVGGRLERAVGLDHQDDAAVGRHEVKHRLQHLAHQLFEVVHQADGARQLVDHAQRLVVHAKLLRVALDLIVGQEALLRVHLGADAARRVVDLDLRLRHEGAAAPVAGRRRR
jgi:hypothetical protein